VRAIAPGKAFWIAIEFQIAPGWHIYWQNPGSSGLPTYLEWRLPKGLRVTRVEWPAPQRFVADGAASYGYSDKAVVLARIEQSSGAGAVGKRLQIGVKAEWLVCREECLSGSGDASARVQVAPRTALEPAATSLFARARAALPVDGSSLQPKATFRNGAIILQFASTQREAPTGAYFFAAITGLVDPDGVQGLRLGPSPSDPYRLEMPTIGVPQKIPEYLTGVLNVSFAKGPTQTFWIKAPCSGPMND